MTILVTGVAGFIGSHVAHALLARGEKVIGLDNLNDYYDPRLKDARLARLLPHPDFTFHKINIADKTAMHALLEGNSEITGVVHLAAQAGVRYSLVNPYSYIESNILGHVVMLELARQWPQLKHFVYASSSSVYGANDKYPFSVEDTTDKPVSLYAATKKADELMSYTYAHLYGIPQTGLRFFTVYGPWGRPDMAYFMFTKAILEGTPIKLNNGGAMKRDFTYIDDIVAGIIAALDNPPSEEKINPPHIVYNLGNHKTEALGRFVEVLEQAIGQKAKVEAVPVPAGDVLETFADIDITQAALGYQPHTAIDEGLPRFVSWYRSFYN